jgi:hypothetical protein
MMIARMIEKATARRIYRLRRLAQKLARLDFDVGGPNRCLFGSVLCLKSEGRNERLPMNHGRREIRKRGTGGVGLKSQGIRAVQFLKWDVLKQGYLCNFLMYTLYLFISHVVRQIG